MPLQFIVILCGLVIVGIGWSLRSRRALIKRSIEHGFKSAKAEYDQEIWDLKKRLNSAEAKIPKDVAWSCDFNQWPPTMVRAKLLKREGYEVEFIRDGDTFPLTGTICAVNILMPDSVQEC